MKVKCPNCETSFVIDEGKSGTAVNCTVLTILCRKKARRIT